VVVAVVLPGVRVVLRVAVCPFGPVAVPVVVTCALANTLTAASSTIPAACIFIVLSPCVSRFPQPLIS
jgi:hypothetical protein